MYSKSKAKNIIAAKYERDALISASACYIPFITLIRPYLQEFGQKFSPTPYGMITKLLYQVRNFFFYQLSDTQVAEKLTSFLTSAIVLDCCPWNSSSGFVFTL